MRNKTYLPLLTIAGSDSGGGAGIQADLKTFAALGAYGMSVITATTAQNTKGVVGIHDIPVRHIVEQLQAVLSDITPKAIKIGMLNRPEVVLALADILSDFPEIPIVYDPVMVATSGDRLIKEETIEVIKSHLFPLSHLITPNLDEASVLVEKQVCDVAGMEQAAEKLLGFGSSNVLVKGGHLQGDKVFDVLLGEGGKRVFDAPKIETRNVHGTGCTLSSAIAAFIGRGMAVGAAVARARQYILGALEAGKDVQTGKGSGPLNHFYQPEKTIKYEVE